MTEPPPAVTTNSSSSLLRITPKNTSIAAVFAFGAFVIVTFVSVNYHWIRGGTLADARADWLVVSAAVDGLDPYVDVLGLASTYQITIEGGGAGELGQGSWVHPRAPSALLLLSPAAALNPEEYRFALLAISAVTLLWIVVVLIPSTSDAPRLIVLLGGPLLLAAYPVFAAFEFATQSIVVSGLILFAWDQWQRNHDLSGGIALGLAAGLKLWPLFILVPIWITGRKRTAAAAAATFGVTLATGMLVFRIDPFEVVGAFANVTERWIGFSWNGSATGWMTKAGIPASISIVLMLGATLVLSVIVARKAPNRSLPAAIVLGLLLSPLSWEHYDVVLVAVAAWLIVQGRWPRVIASMWLALSFFGMLIRQFDAPDFSWVGVRTLAGRILLAVAVVVPAFLVEKNEGDRNSTVVEP